MLTIGQLARIFEISTKTLRHYDAIGLFVPARTGSDNGYRYYRPEQIEQLSRILALRRLDVPLEAIDRLKTRWRAGRPATPAAFPATTPAHPARRDQRPPAPAGGTRPNPGDARPLEDPQHACTNRRTSRLQRGGHGILRQRPRRHHRPALGTLHPARARDRRQARSRGLLWHLRAAAQRRIPLRRRLRGAGGLAGAGGHGALPGAGAEVRGVHPQGHGAADRRELPGDLQPPARRTRPGAQGGGRLRILRPAFPRTAGSELASRPVYPIY